MVNKITFYKCFCKINIGLNVLKYNNRYQKHELLSIFCLIDDFIDELSIALWNTNRVVYYQNGELIQFENDLIKRTLVFMQNEFNIKENFIVRVRKKIPVQSGLGGASSNAAAVIKHLIKQYNLQLNEKIKLKIAAELGSDIMFFLSGYELAYVRGIGENVAQIKQTKPYYKLISNSESCPTAQIYNLFKQNPLTQMNDYDLIEKSLPNLSKINIINDLQPYALNHNKALQMLYNSLRKENYNITLSGSGSFFIQWIGDENES